MKEHRALDMLLAPGGITPVYQPLYAVRAGHYDLYGVECLSRGPKGTNFESANVLFDYIRLKREESMIDRACIAASLENGRNLPPRIQIGINVHASTLGRDHGFVPFLATTAAATGIEMSRLTIEIVEHAPPWDGVSFLAALDELRGLGSKIALDDVGLGQSNFKMILDVGPDFLKLDRYFVEGCANDTKRQAVLSVVTEVGKQFGAEVVAEGVEDAATLETLSRYSIRLMQGFYFAKPMEIDELREYAKDAIRSNSDRTTAFI